MEVDGTSAVGIGRTVWKVEMYILHCTGISVTGEYRGKRRNQGKQHYILL